MISRVWEATTSGVTMGWLLRLVTGGPTGRGPQQFWRLILIFVFVVIE